MDASFGEIQRPEIVTRLLELKDGIKDRDEAAFREFLEEVEQAQLLKLRIQNVAQITLTYQVANLEWTKPAENSSLRIAFDFYAKLQTPGQQLATSNVTYELVRFANETLSFHELAVWMRDFMVVPSLLTKSELRFLWKMTSLQWVRMGKEQIKYLTFDMFRDFFARMAIMAYNKPGMKRLILGTTGVMPSPADLVETLCHFMHLDDFGWVKERLNTTGRDSVRQHNFRSAGEKNEVAKSELRNDVKGTRFAQLMTQVAHKVHDEDPAGDPNKEEEEDEAVEVEGYGNKLGHDDLDQATKIAEALNRKINGLGSSSKDDEADAKKQKKDGIFKKKDTNHFASHGLKISEGQEEALLNYDTDLSKLLDKYSLKPARLGALDTEQISGGAFIDLGRQCVGRTIVVNVNIVNTSSHEMQVDVMASGFKSDDCKVTMLARSFAPGLKRDASVQFTILDPPDGSNIMGFIDVHCVPVRGTQGEVPVMQRCPVFYRPYRTGPALVDIPICNINNLPTLISKYCKRKELLDVNFEKTRECYRGPAWRDGPVLRLPPTLLNSPILSGPMKMSIAAHTSGSPSKTQRQSKARSVKTSGFPPVSSPIKSAVVTLPGSSRGTHRHISVETGLEMFE